MINYDDILKEFRKFSNAERASFTKKICQTERIVLGVKVPDLRHLAKKIVQTFSLDEFLLMNHNDTLEDILLEGFVLGYSKMSFVEKKKYLQDFIPKIDNWLICDTFCSTIKVKAKELNICYEFLLPYLKSQKEFEERFAIVMLLDNFLIDDYVDQVIELLDSVQSPFYYTKMAKSWILAEIGIKYYEKLMKYLKSKNHLDDFTYHKTLQKMIESYRITEEQKVFLRKMKNGRGGK